MVRGSAFALFAAALLTGTIADRAVPVRGDGGILSADLHVHGGLPLDATLPPWELQKEARRRGLDAIAIVGHNHPLAARYERLMSDDVVVLPGLEVLSANRHMIAAGVRGWIDWRLPADAAIEATHRQGGVAIAAHPVRISWVTRNARALSLLDGAEVVHPLIDFEPNGAREMLEFYQGARAGNPSIAPIGSSDNHGLNDIGNYRTYLIGAERSERGVLEAIREGRTVAADGRGNLTGSPEHIAAVRAHLASRPPATPGSLQRWSAVTALLALAVAMIFR